MFDFDTSDYGAHITEQPEKLMLQLDAPGFTPDEVKVTVNGRLISIFAEHQTEDQTPKRRLKRVYRIPETVLADNAEAQLKNGVLTLTLPKRQELLPRTIPVKADLTIQ